MAKIIINADDFGYNRSINYGILDAHLYGVLTSATFMVTMPGASHGAALSKKYPSLKIGLHLNISLGKPITGGKSLTGPEGNFMKPSALTEKHMYDEEEIYRELEAQYDRFLALTDKKPTHLDSHLFTTDKIEPMKKAALRLSEKYALPLRNHDTAGKKHVEFITFRTFNEPPGLEYLKKHFHEICRHPYAEIMSHPGYLDNYVLNNTSYTYKRCDELDILCSDWLKELIEKNGAELISYEDIAK